MKKVGLILLCCLLSAGLFAAGQKDSGKAAQPAKSVTVLAVWGGQELDAFNAVVAPFTQKTGIKMEFEGTRDIDAVLTTRVQAGNPPDVAGLPGPGKMAELGRAGSLVDLGTVFDMNEMKQNYAQSWLDMASVDGKLYGLFMKTSPKGFIWYNVQTVKQNNIPVPKTWEEMMQISKQAADRGIAPWAIGIESGAASGWAGTDWLEDIFLRLNGPAKYKDWYEGKIAWTAPEMKQTWEMWGQIIGNDKMIYGGRQYVNSTNFGQAPGPLFMDPPKALFHHQASFIQSFITEMYPTLKPVENFDFFAFPAINAQYSAALESGGDLFSQLKKGDAGNQFMKFLASTEAQTQWVKLSGSISANKNVPLDAYPDPITRKAAEIQQKSTQTVFDASDMMPSEMNAAFWSAVVEYVNNPKNLDSILAGLDRVRATAYKK